MGFCYDSGGLLCCDKCGQSVNVSRRKCPSGYCQSIALHGKCFSALKKSGEWKEMHKNCEVRHNEYVAMKNKEQELLNSGQMIRCSALQIGETGRVRVLFKDKNNVNIAYEMSVATYRAIPFGVPATIEDYQVYGTTKYVPQINFDDLYA